MQTSPNRSGPTDFSPVPMHNLDEHAVTSLGAAIRSVRHEVEVAHQVGDGVTTWVRRRKDQTIGPPRGVHGRRPAERHWKSIDDETPASFGGENMKDVAGLRHEGRLVRRRSHGRLRLLEVRSPDRRIRRAGRRQHRVATIAAPAIPRRRSSRRCCATATEVRIADARSRARRRYGRLTRRTRRCSGIPTL